MARVIFETGPDKGLTFYLRTAKTRMGRGVSNDLQIPDKRCSRNHAVLVRKPEGFVLRDLGSKNRSFVNERTVKEEQRLYSGDRLRLGSTVLVFEEEGEEDLKHRSDTASQSIHLTDDPDSQWGELQGAVAVGKPDSAVSLQEIRGEAITDPLHRLEVLYDVSEKIRSILQLGPLLEQIADVLQEVLRPDTLIVLLTDDEDEFRPRIVRSEGLEDQQIQVSRSIVDRCVEERVSVLVSDAAQDKRFKASESIVANRIRSAICSPMINNDEVLGVVYADTKSSLVPYNQEELSLVTGIVNQAAMAIANARLHDRLVLQNRFEREMEIARTIQINLLPREAPKTEKLDVWGASIPAKKVGGDYFDFVTRDPWTLALAVADVSGKGVPAAMLTAIMRASLQIFATEEELDVGNVIQRLNQTICRDATDNMFVSAVFGVLDQRRRLFTYSNAGHCYPVLFLPDGKREELDRGGCLLGIDRKSTYEVASVEIPPGAVLVLYTDGVVDMVDSEDRAYGEERFLNEIEEMLDRSAESMGETILDSLRDFRGTVEQFDDCTLVILKALP